MLSLELADSLKVFVNWDKSETTRETLEYPYDFYRAIEYGLREIGKHVRIYEKILWIPISTYQRYYTIDLSKLTEDKIELAKILKLSILSKDGEPTTCIKDKYIEQIHKTQYIDVFAIAEQIYGNSLNLISQATEEGVDDSIFCNLVTVDGANDLTVSQSLPVQWNLFNLSMSDKEEYYKALITIGGTSITLDKDVGISPYLWKAGNKLFCSSGHPSFIRLLIQAIPSIGMFTLGTETIPSTDKIIDYVKSLAVSYLYTLLIARDINEANRYNALLSTKVIMPKESAMTEAKRISVPSKPLIIESYDPY